MPHFGIYHGTPVVDKKKDKNKNDKKNKKKPKIRKEDIGHPTNFQHKAHLGWDVDGGFSQRVCQDEPLDESVKEMIRAAGQNPDDLNNKDVAFVREFISNYQETPDLNEPSFSQQSPLPAPPPPMSRPNAGLTREYNYRPPTHQPGYQQQQFQQPYVQQSYQSTQIAYQPPVSCVQTPPPAPMRDSSMAQANQHRPLRPPPMEPRSPPVVSLFYINICIKIIIGKNRER